MRVERSFGFIDLCGFTRFCDAYGDEEGVRVLKAFRAAVRDVATDFGVRVAKWLGDGAMFVGLDGDVLVAAVLRLEQQMEHDALPLPLRAGIARGPVLVFEGDDYTGSTINLAARLCDAAGPHEILATPEAADPVPTWVDVQPAGPRDVAGFAQPVQVVRLVARTSTSAPEPQV